MVDHSLHLEMVNKIPEYLWESRRYDLKSRQETGHFISMLNSLDFSFRHEKQQMNFKYENDMIRFIFYIYHSVGSCGMNWKFGNLKRLDPGNN